MVRLVINESAAVGIIAVIIIAVVAGRILKRRLFPALVVPEPPTTALKGTITNGLDGTSLVGATVTLTKNGQTVASAQTGEDGKYEFVPVASGVYTLKAHKNTGQEDGSYYEGTIDNLTLAGETQVQDLATVRASRRCIKKSLVVGEAVLRGDIDG